MLIKIEIKVIFLLLNTFIYKIKSKIIISILLSIFFNYKLLLISKFKFSKLFTLNDLFFCNVICEETIIFFGEILVYLQTINYEN